MPTAVITFDDVVRSQLENAVPVLQKHGFKATFFVCDWFRDSRIHALKQGMDMADLKTLHQLGFELGNHTKDHANPASLSVEENKAQVAYIEDLFKELQVPAPKVYAYPGAPYVEKAATAVKSMGYIAARTGGNRPLDLTALNLFDMPSYLLCDDHPECFDKAFAALKEGKTVILTYHGIPDVEHPWCNVSVEHFTEHMQRLADIGCKCPTYSELMKQCQ